MPLRCIDSSSGEAVAAYDLDRVQWKRLAETYRHHHHLVMPCCARAAIPKRSHLGLQFFAHARREGLGCPRETAQHLQAKDLVARAVVAAGWHAETEAQPVADGPIADVLAVSGQRRIAIEVQWSRQTYKETERRHHAWHAAGIRDLWLFRQWEYPLAKEIPAFNLLHTADGFHVSVWRDGNGFQKPKHVYQSVELGQFVTGALNGRLKWTPAAGLPVPVVGHVVPLPCRRGHPAVALASLEIDIRRQLPGHMNVNLPVDAFADVPEILRTHQVRDLLAAAGVTLQFGISNLTVDFRDNYRPYILPACSTCGSTLDTFRIEPSDDLDRPGLELPITLTPTLLKRVRGLGKAIECWWFDST